MWTWLPQSWEDWVLLLCLSAASSFVMYEAVLLRWRKPLREETESMSSLLEFSNGTDYNASKIIDKKEAS